VHLALAELHQPLDEPAETETFGIGHSGFPDLQCSTGL
jgi:hypothetical protein